MSGLKEIRRHMYHNVNDSCAKLAGVDVRALQAFAAGYILMPEQALHNLTNFIWHGRKKYDAATDTLVDIPTL